MNELFREHVTSAAFVLTLGKTHVAELVRLDLELAYEAGLDGRDLGKLHRCDMTARKALMGRGLIEHHRDPATEPGGARHEEWVQDVLRRTWRPNETWSITRAGRLVCELLAEAGLYQEYAGPLLPLVEAQAKRRRKALA